MSDNENQEIVDEVTGPLGWLGRKAHTTAVEHGFWGDPVDVPSRNVGEMLALVHSEVSEALEAYRTTGLQDGYEMKWDDKRPDDDSPYSLLRREFRDVQDLAGLNPTPDGEVNPIYAWVAEHRRTLVDLGVLKPIGYTSEMADAIIRIVEMCYAQGLNLDAAVRDKMAYNETRPHMHGKAF